jgi:hypothetical protein
MKTVGPIFTLRFTAIVNKHLELVIWNMAWIPYRTDSTITIVAMMRIIKNGGHLILAVTLWSLTVETRGK